MDQDHRRSISKEISRSIVRICFNWKADEGYEFMVIPGIILSIDADGRAEIAADVTFFKIANKFVVNFPKASGGYEERIDVSITSEVHETNIYIFTLKPKENGYIKPIRFETQPPKNHEDVDAFVFPRKGYVTSTGYCRGYIIDVTERVLIYDCGIHEYGYLGSPLFNLSGHLVGITYLNQGRMHAWTVWQLLNYDLNNRKSTLTLVSNGKSMGEDPEAQIVEAPVDLVV